MAVAAATPVGLTSGAPSRPFPSRNMVLPRRQTKGALRVLAKSCRYSSEVPTTVLPSSVTS
jgi:hypothetical protein